MASRKYRRRRKYQTKTSRVPRTKLRLPRSKSGQIKKSSQERSYSKGSPKRRFHTVSVRSTIKTKHTGAFRNYFPTKKTLRFAFHAQHVGRLSLPQATAA